MHRRSRHLNPRAAGASLVLDARYIIQANNTAVATWPDISGSINNATQATGAKQPTFKTNQQGGQPVVSFTGAGGMECTSGLGGSTSEITIIVTLKSYNYNGTAGGGMIMSQGGATAYTQDFLLGRQSATFFFQFNSGTDGSATFSSPVAGNQIQTVIYDGRGTANADRLRLILNGASQTMTYDYTVPASINPSGGYSIGQYSCAISDTSWYMNGDLCSLFLIKTAITSSLRKRLEQSRAFSFKMLCS